MTDTRPPWLIDDTPAAAPRGGGPWEDGTVLPLAPPPAAPTLFDRQFYGDAPPTSSASAAPSEGLADWADIGKGAAGGLGRGTAGLIGLPGTIGNLTREGLAYIGVPEPVLNATAKAVRHMPGMAAFTGPDANQVQQAIEGYTGKFYQPQTTPGKYASTLAEFAPTALIPGGGSLASRAINTAVPAVASETAGQLTAGTAAEPWARALGGIAGGSVGAKLVTPTAPPSAAYQANVDALKAAGVPLTAGVRTGSRPLQWMESAAADMPIAGPAAARLAGRSLEGYSRAATGQVFNRNAPAFTRADIPPEATLPSPDVMAAGKQSLKDEYARLTAANTLRSDPQLMRENANTLAEYERMALPSQRAGGSRDLAAFHDDVLNRLIADQGNMAGDVYQTIRSQAGKHADTARANDPNLSTAFGSTQKSLDAAMARSMSPEDAAAWADTNRRYALMKQIEGPVAKASGEYLSPAAVAQAFRTGRTGQYAVNGGVMDPFVRSSEALLKPLPNSGTAARLGAQQLFNLPALLLHSGPTGAAGGALGSMFGPMGMAAGAVGGAMLPSLAARGAVSNWGQRYLGNQLAPQRMRDVLAHTLVQQGATLPEARTRHDVENVAYERQQAEQRRRLGLTP